jgi:ABC-2 type transport system ATP-binding protein
VSITCERVIIINEVRIVAEDRIENLSTSVSGSKRFRMEVEGPSKDIAERLRRVKGVLKVQYDDSRFIIETNPGEDPRSRMMQEIVKGGWTMLSL